MGFFTILIVITLLSSGLLILGVWLDWEDIITGILYGATWLVGVVLLVVLMILPFQRMESYQNVERYHAVKESLEYAREHGDEIETAAIQKNIIDFNAQLASARYYNDHGFDVFIVDEFAELEPLR